MNWLKVFSISVFAILLSGCVSDHKSAKFQLHYNQYSHEITKRVRSAKLYLKLETVMIVDVIYIDKGLREAWVDQVSRARRLGEKQKGDILDQQMAKEKFFNQFVLAVYTSEEEWNDFADQDTRWTLLLNSEHPVTVEKVKLENLEIRDHIPFDPRFRTFYEVSFPKESSSQAPYRLTMSSPLGEVNLGW